MSTSDYNIIGNGSSIFKVIGLTIAGYSTPLLIKWCLLYGGVDLSGQETEIMQWIGIIVAWILSYIDMKFANSFFKKNITLEDYVNYGVENFGLEPVENKTDDGEVVTDYDLAGEYELKQ